MYFLCFTLFGKYIYTHIYIHILNICYQSVWLGLCQFYFGILLNVCWSIKAVRTRHGITDYFPIGKGVSQGCILSPCLFSLYVEYIMWNARLDEEKLESRFSGEISITSDMQMTPPYGRKQRRTKELLDENERGEWKSWLKTQHSEN